MPFDFEQLDCDVCGHQDCVCPPEPSEYCDTCHCDPCQCDRMYDEHMDNMMETDDEYDD